jgi:hypothetical protein
MKAPQLVLDAIGILMLLRIPAALVCLYKAAVSIGQGFSVAQIFAGSFSRWMGWAIVFITIPELLLWFSNVGLDTSSVSSNIQGTWLSSAEKAIETFTRTVVIKNLARAVAAWFLIRAVFHIAHQESPLPSVLACFALLSLDSLSDLLQSYRHSNNPNASTDMVLLLWQFAAGRLAPVAGGCAAIGIVWNVAHKRSWIYLAGAALGFFCLFGLWALTKSWMGIAG